MKTFMLLLSLVALAAPVAAFADAPPSPAQTAQKMCVADRTAMGTGFATVYKTFGKCVSSHTKAAQNALDNASKSCKAKLAGTNTDKNAMGKCVSQAVQSAVAAQAKAAKAALKSCLADRKANKASFATTYGAGKDALSKCVTAKSTK
jgi:hypothetical protein